jgi:hypothetical protein
MSPLCLTGSSCLLAGGFALPGVMLGWWCGLRGRGGLRW